MAEYSKLLETLSGSGHLLRETVASFLLPVTYRLNRYQQVSRAGDQEVLTSQSMEGHITPAEPRSPKWLLLYDASDLVLLLNDGRRIAISIPDPHTGKIFERHTDQQR